MAPEQIKYNMLIVDDEPEILNSLKRVFYKEYSVDLFEDGATALAALKTKQYAIIISDMRMPNMDGATFLAKAKEDAPDAIRFLLTGYSDFDSTIKAVNEGAIFAYVEKPWNNQELRSLINNGLNHYLLKQENKQLSIELSAANLKLAEHNKLLEQKVKERTQALIANTTKLKSSIKTQRELFHQLLDMVETLIKETLGDMRGHTKRIATHGRLLAQELELEKSEVQQVYLAGLMLDIGQITLPKSVTNTPVSELSTEQKNAYLASASRGAEIIKKIPRLKHVANMVLHQFENVNGEGTPGHLKSDAIPLGSRILRLVNDFDRLLLGKNYPETMSNDDARFYLKENSGKLYDRKLVDVYLKLLEKLPDMEALNTDFCMSIKQLEPGMTLAQDVLNKSGGVMLTKDSELTAAGIEKLKQYEEQMEYHLSIYVY